MAAEEAAQGAPPARGPARRILLVDDNRDSATLMAMMLSLTGNKVRTAHDGVEAVEVAEVFRPQVILMDVGMPRLNGYEATRRIRQQLWGRFVTILALTDHSCADWLGAGRRQAEVEGGRLRRAFGQARDPGRAGESVEGIRRITVEGPVMNLVSGTQIK